MQSVAQLKAIAYFEAVARHGQIAKAAIELKVTASAISQQITNLESRFGNALFRRVKKRLVLTDDGERLYASVTTALQEIRNAQHRASMNTLAKGLVVRIAPSLGINWLSDRLPDFIIHNPDIELRLSATSELTNFSKELVDVEIHYTSTPSAELFRKALINDRILPLCAPQLATVNKEKSLGEIIESTRLIYTVKSAIQWTDWCEARGIHKFSNIPSLKFDRSLMALAAARQGLGIALESATLALNDIKQGNLVPLFPELPTYSFDAYWIQCPFRNKNRPLVNKFISWIEIETQAHILERDKILASYNVMHNKAWI